MTTRGTMVRLGTLCFWLVSSLAQAGEPSFATLPDIDVRAMMMDIATLSDKRFEGRQAGTLGGKRSRDFVRKRMESLHLVPSGESKGHGATRSWYQHTQIPVVQFPQTADSSFSSVRVDRDSWLAQPKLGPGFLPIFDSPSVNAFAPVTFVGYGIEDPARGVNDYENMDVRNRIVMFLRGKPKYFRRWVTLEEKVKTAQKHGALGFVTLTGPVLDGYEARRGLGEAPLAIYASPPGVRPLPGIWISGGMGQSLFRSEDLSLRDIQTQLNARTSHQSRELGIVAHFRWNSDTGTSIVSNVLGVIPGTDPILRDQVVILGAHRDHFGKQAGLLFAGADDNASGTAVLLEIARIMTQSKPGPKRTIVFASFDGEERGLIGSRLYIQNPSYPLEKTTAMINVDHVGVGNGRLTVGITRLQKTIGRQAAIHANLEGKTNFFGYFPGGDHVPFYEAGIPTVTVVSGGKHTSFHQPSDTAEKIQPEILQRVTRYVLAITWQLTHHD